jgi:hypothetical protein
VLFVPSVVSLCVFGSFAFAIAHHDLLITKVEILDPQTQAIHQPQARAVEQSGHEPEGLLQSLDQAGDFVLRENHGQFARSLGASELAEVAEVDLQYVFVQEDDGIERLILRGGRDVAIDCKVTQEAIDFCGSHLGWMPFAVEKDESADPLEVSLFGPQAVMVDPQDISDRFEQLRLLSRTQRDCI